MSENQTTIGAPYRARLEAAGPLGEELWRAVKDARDSAHSRMMEAEHEYARLEALLKQMQAAGLCDHLPTIDEVRENAIHE